MSIHTPEAAPFFRAARLHLSFVRLYRKNGDPKYAAMSAEWAAQDHKSARDILMGRR